MPTNTTYFKAACFMLLSCLFLAINNNLVKYLGVYISPITLVFYKNFFSLLLLLPIIPFYKNKVLSLKYFNKYNFSRSAVDVASSICWFVALNKISTSQAVALSFLTPIFIVLLAAICLKETLRKDAIIMLGLGFCGAIVTMEVNIDLSFNYYTIFAILAAALWAIGAILFKKLTYIQDSFVLLLYLKIIKTFISVPLLIYDYHILNLSQIIYVTFIGIFINLAVFCLSKAYKYSDISAIIPLDFMRLVLTAIIAYYFLGEVIKMPTLIGSVIILISAVLLIGNRSRQV